MLEDKFVDMAGTKIHYIEAGNGMPFLFVHGARFNARTYEESGTIDTVSGSGFHAISIDFPGYGKSENMDINLSDFIAKFIDAMKLEPGVVLGASMGGEAVVGFAVKYPEKFKALVLAGAVGVSEYENQLNKIADKPMLLMWGKNDMVSPVTNYQLLMKYDKNAEFYNVGRQHACYLDDNKSFNDHIEEFLKRIK